MSEKRPWSTKSAAHRFGFLPCPSCNPNEVPSGEIPKNTHCAWCWSDEDKVYRRYVLREVAEKWALEHGLAEDDIPTSPESRDALQVPPKLETPIPPTDPDPSRS